MGRSRGQQAPTQLPQAPTQVVPGTPAKLAVLEQRAANGEELWHPNDGPSLE